MGFFENPLFRRLKFEFQLIYDILIASTMQISDSVAQFLISFGAIEKLQSSIKGNLHLLCEQRNNPGIFLLQ